MTFFGATFCTFFPFVLKKFVLVGSGYIILKSESNTHHAHRISSNSFILRALRAPVYGCYLVYHVGCHPASEVEFVREICGAVKRKRRFTGRGFMRRGGGFNGVEDIMSQQPKKTAK